MTMILGLNGATLATASLDTGIRAARDAGFAGYEPRTPVLEGCEARGGREAALAAVAEIGLTWLPLNALEGVFALDGPTLPSQATAVFSLAARFRVPQVILVPGSARIAESAAHAELAWLKTQATQHHVSVLYELIGFPTFAFPSLDQAYDLASAAGVPLVLDTFHLAVSRTSPGEIARLPKAAIGLVHLSDAITAGKAVEELRDEDRVLPGEGGLPLVDILTAIHRTGYRGPVSVEVFHPKYGEQDPYAVARDAHRRARQVLAQAGWQL
ncbi:MAG: sugar phosphate isomerase/epimerase [Candidatus Acetothermia bacterium]|jgi:2-keto-myo-inositol isomerase|nr:sugar phosphate isomerase/epimerase [Candidatus Acetothermia bacterium]